MAQRPNLFPLKLLVISLGLVLIGGTIFVGAAIANKAGKELHTCPDAKINLQGKGSVTNISAQGDSVQITLSTPQHSELITVDRCSGKILQTLTIEP